MKFQNLSVKRLFGRVAIGFALSMSGITIALAVNGLDVGRAAVGFNLAADVYKRQV